ncbi:winged helix-turn-helix domain-containing protein [Candidatus Alkanophaga liquidiphilum]|nr:hypothetical protein [Candidatus Alkanophaga liquidiphilum]RLG36141.1 MAG: hypothetical protein DRN91_08645 [Candidatus Alkanophagales archaeon]
MHGAVGSGDVKKRIMKLLANEAQPMTISEIAKKVGVSWATAKTHVLELSQANLLKVKKFGRNWIVWKEFEKRERRTCSVFKR